MAHTGLGTLRKGRGTGYTEALMNPMLTDCCMHLDGLNKLKFHNTEINCTGVIILRIGVNFSVSPSSLSVCLSVCLSVSLFSSFENNDLTVG